MPATRLILAEQEERERYAEKHATFAKDMNKALRAIARADFRRGRSDRYILAEYKWPYK